MNVTVAELGLAPGKSMRALNPSSIEIDNRGLFGDREYMWVEAGEYTNQTYKPGTQNGPGRFISQREDPVLTKMAPIATTNGIHLAYEGSAGLFVPRAEDSSNNRTPVSVWKWSGEAVDQGNEAAEWGSTFIGRSVRLVAISEHSPRYVENNPALGRTGFTDGFTITVGSTASFSLINQHLESQGRPTIPIDRARANIILDGLEHSGTGEKAVFPEDYIDTITLTSGGLQAVLKRWKACGRCPVPDTNQLTGERKTHVRAALGKLGRTGLHINTAAYGEDSDLFLTQNFVVRLSKNMPPDATFKIERGANIEVTMASGTNWIPAK